jgi:hypothetical protein
VNHHQLQRLLEEAADEVARLDQLCQLAPNAVARASRATVVGTLEGSPDAPVALVSAAVDPTHRAALSPDLARWADDLDAEERRVRGGTPLTAARLAALGPVNDPAALDAAVRSGSEVRAVLARAVEAAAAVGSGALADLTPALLLCAAGQLDRLWFLPFASLDGAARLAALAEWDAGDEWPFLQLALTGCAAAARAHRMRVKRALEAVSHESERLRSLGRAGITARRTLDLLRADLATTMPALADRLDCSRPAAGAALDRLVELGLALEITGRNRDRVFVHAAAWAT